MPRGARPSACHVANMLICNFDMNAASGWGTHRASAHSTPEHAPNVLILLVLYGRC